MSIFAKVLYFMLTIHPQKMLSYSATFSFYTLFLIVLKHKQAILGPGVGLDRLV